MKLLGDRSVVAIVEFKDQKNHDHTEKKYRRIKLNTNPVGQYPHQKINHYIASNGNKDYHTKCCTSH